MDTEHLEWTTFNQSYLIAAIDELSVELEQYRDAREAASPAEAVRPERSQTEESQEQAAIDLLAERLGLSTFEKKMLLLCAGVELDASFAKLIRELGQVQPTFSLALAVFAEDAHWSALHPQRPLRYWQLIQLEAGPSLTNAPCSIDESILHYLTGITYPERAISDRLELIPATGSLVPSQQVQADKLADLIAGMDGSSLSPLIQLSGNCREDHAQLVAATFTPLGWTSWRLPATLLPTDFGELAEFTLRWNREALLNDYVLLVETSTNSDQLTGQFQPISYFLEQLQGIALLSSNRKLTTLRRSIISIEVDYPSREEQYGLWQQELEGSEALSESALSKISTQFNLSARSIHRLARQSRRSGMEAAAVTSGELYQNIWQACLHHTRPQMETLGQRIEPLATWEELILPESQKASLREIAVQVQQRRKVYFQWGFAGKSHRGLGISALFSGVSGTGKTMAAEVLANELQLDLFRIDLSQVVNKYIGETEKNLKRIFDAAEGSGAILLFDEADALFGRRSEVRDSHDRYANIEVSYLLQKMEEYRGLAILTTNMKKALDQAFLRRIRFVVSFPFPDARARAEIWKRIFPEQTPTQDLDIDRLAVLNITGGNIRNIALNAAFSAAGQDQSVRMEDLQKAARNEYLKLEKPMSVAENLL